MSNKTALSIYHKLSNQLLNLNLIRKDLRSYKVVKNFIKSPSIMEDIGKIVEEKDYSCKRILNFCHDMLYELSGKKLPNDWLNYVYQYSLNNSFPCAVDIDFYKDLDIACIVYLEILRVFSEFEKTSNNNTCQSKYPLNFLTEDEENNLVNPNEYKKFKKVFRDNYVYEMMKLSQEITRHNTLDHICGVHHLALYIGRQLFKIGLPVDLGRVSGAAAGHDIGKYGCKGPELKRVPYLHYYYTDLWFKRHNIQYIGHIATNHSTWDLELENLSLESLILIYSDFRVKNKRKKDGSKEMYVYSLKESFDIVLNKLDNVDETKEKRYRRVYAKLKDFENYMINLGVEVELGKDYDYKPKKKYYSLIHGNQIVENLKYLSIDHNIHLMNKLKNVSSLNSILELARSENDWKKLRAYLQIFEEYSTYLTQKQKLITLNFLYELLIHKEGDIRKQCAELIGILIAKFDEKYRKEVPKDVELEPPEITSSELLNKYIKLFLYPDHKIIEIHREWIGYNLRNMISALFMHCEDSQKLEYRNILLKYFKRTENIDKNIQFYLLQCVKYIPYINTIDKPMEILFEFVLKMINSEDLEIRLAALERTYNLLFRLDKNNLFVNKLKNMLTKNIVYCDVPAENFLKLKIAERLKINKEILDKYKSFYKKDKDKIPDLFLKNLKSATNWISKKIHIELLLEEVIKSPKRTGLHTAMHFCNLVKVSAIENVRNHAGEALVKIIPSLSLDQRNDVTVELLRALEMQGYQFTKYIPYYLGQIMLYLHPVELDELIDDFEEKIRQSNTQISLLLLKTIGVAIQHYPKYKNFFDEEEKKYKKRLIKMLGILLTGLVNYDIQVKQEAFSVIGKDIFGSKELNLEEKREIFQYIAKKILTLLTNKDENELLFLNNSAALNHIYRFISDYVFFKGEIKLNHSKKIAFFPGSFDPFSLSHKKIAKEIRDMGFEVYLAVDEYSWSKRTQPHKLRRRIINMSIADELDIYLFPEDIQVNIANPNDLKVLKEIFNNYEVYIVAGTDVVLNASCYKKKIEKYSIHNFPHIIFKRRSFLSTEDDDIKFEKAVNKINGEIIRLSLPPQYEDISSTRIRNYIDQNRDISQLIDSLAQKYIYEYGLYRREPQYKRLVQTKSLDIEVFDDLDEGLLDILVSQFFKNSKDAYTKLKNLKSKLSPRIIIIRDINNNGKIIGFSAFHWVRSSMLFHEFKNNNISEYIRENAVGRIIAIDGIFIDKDYNYENLEQILLTETLAFCLAKDYNYAIFHNIIEDYFSETLYENLKLQGFKELHYVNKQNPVLVVDMSNPCTLNLDLETLIKEPFRSNQNVLKVIQQTRKNLQIALTKLYPGQLVLSFDRNVLYDKLIEKICEVNNMPTKQLKPRKLGPYMCVPFGSILNGCIVPNTVTKSMHTEKLFSSNIRDFTIGPFPYYMSLENQIKMIHSFNREVILVDDLLNKGYRIKVIDPLLKNEQVKVRKIIVGILSGRGKELMDIQNREVDSAYFIPNLRVWFKENTLYPFIGGDTVWRGLNPQRNLLPSINFILPYASPSFIRGTTRDAVYNLSEVCINNALDIITTLEKEYQNINERNLTLRHLGEVFISPRCPDRGKNIDYDLNLKPSEYLRNDIEHLKRIKDMVIR
ncbi:nicotinate-nicotinamide nucleotide adenylyltransferase [Thermohalobacter berrensis]|uniref:nicotinate-nucleotide adenylyltransferase n=1 Tax=Thermohalobacter berrensis TaxID=99594 RepID=A0A419SV89_9FIRM|nr:cytidyltransferase [Thermohalobacter berrensis]RKD29144.1 cytidyltransferase [Thermohalobacter berrensis]